MISICETHDFNHETALFKFLFLRNDSETRLNNNQEKYNL